MPPPTIVSKARCTTGVAGCCLAGRMSRPRMVLSVRKPVSSDRPSGISMPKRVLPVLGS